MGRMRLVSRLLTAVSSCAPRSRTARGTRTAGHARRARPCESWLLPPCPGARHERRRSGSALRHLERLELGCRSKIGRAISAMGRITSVESWRDDCCSLTLSPFVSRSVTFCSTACVVKVVMTSSSRLLTAKRSTPVNAARFSTTRRLARWSALINSFSIFFNSVSSVECASVTDAQMKAATVCVFHRWPMCSAVVPTGPVDQECDCAIRGRRSRPQR
jgi:hypothetical protein